MRFIMRLMRLLRFNENILKRTSKQDYKVSLLYAY